MANWPGYKHGHPPSHAPYPNLGIRYMAASAPILRANAAGKLAMGVHEIEQFNFFCTDQPNIPGLRADYGALRGVHDLAFLRGKPKHYCLSAPSGRPSSLWETPEQVPAVLDPKNRREFRLAMCAEPGRYEAGGASCDRTHRRSRRGSGSASTSPGRASRAVKTQDMLFPVGPYTQFTETYTAWEFELPSSAIREGWNTVTVINNTKNPPAPVKVVSLELASTEAWQLVDAAPGLPGPSRFFAEPPPRRAGWPLRRDGAVPLCSGRARPLRSFQARAN
jgi:hypothetical protein